jgi:hypothetical protein
LEFDPEQEVEVVAGWEEHLTPAVSAAAPFTLLPLFMDRISVVMMKSCSSCSSLADRD